MAHHCRTAAAEAMRVAISFDRWLPRASSSAAMVTHAIRSTVPTAASSITIGSRTPSTSAARSGSTPALVCAARGGFSRNAAALRHRARRRLRPGGASTSRLKIDRSCLTFTRGRRPKRRPELGVSRGHEPARHHAHHRVRLARAATHDGPIHLIVAAEHALPEFVTENGRRRAVRRSSSGRNSRPRAGGTRGRGRIPPTRAGWRTKRRGVADDEVGAPAEPDTNDSSAGT